MKSGLHAGLDYLRNEPDLKHSAQVGFVTFADEVEFYDFQSVEQASLPSLRAIGMTALKRALGRTADEVTKFACKLNAEGRKYSATTVLLISDGGGNDGDCSAEVKRLVELHRQKEIVLIAAGVTPEDSERLRSMGFPIVFCVAEITWEEAIRKGTCSAKCLRNGQVPTGENLTGDLT